MAQGLFSFFQSYFAILMDDTLKIYENDKVASPLYEIPLMGASLSVFPPNRFTVRISSKKSPKTVMCRIWIEVFDATYAFKIDSPEAYHSWLLELQHVSGLYR